MSEEKAFGIKSVRDCLLNYLTSVQDLKNLSLLNRQMHGDVWKLLESKCVLPITNQQIREYTNHVKEPIISGKYISLIYAPDETWFKNKKFNQVSRSKVAKRLQFLGPRINQLWIYMRTDENSDFGLMPVEEVVDLFKSCKDVTNFHWTLEGNDEKKLGKLFGELNDLMDKENNFSFDLAKSLEIDGISDTAWDFWASVLVEYFPNLENLKVGNHLADNNTISNFLEDIDDLGKLESLKGLTCHGELMEGGWSRLLDNSLSLSKFHVEICGANISFFKLFLEKYKHQLEDVKLYLGPGFGSLHFPPMKELRKLDFWFRRGHASSHAEQLLITEDEEAYPKLREIYLGGFDIESIMVCFRNISKNRGVSAKVQKVTAHLNLDPQPYFQWIESGRENIILGEFNRLFPNADNKLDYGQNHRHAGYPELLSYRGILEKDEKRCIIT